MISNPYFFGVSAPYAKRLSTAEVTRRREIAKRHGCEFVATDMPDGYRYWFAKQNEGAPFDGDTARRVMAEVRA